jgi:SnoaL-like domain
VNLSTEDRLDILELVVRADNAATTRDVDTYVALFTQDGVLDGEKGKHCGREALAVAVVPVWASEGTKSSHLTLNTVIDPAPDRPGEATATSTLLILDPGPPVVVLSVTSIVQSVIKTEGSWLIARRTVASA